MFTQPSVNQIASAYQGNPAPLAQKVDKDKKQNGGIPQDLRQLLALNDITQGRNAVGIQQALQAPTNMPTVAQDLQERARQALQARAMQQAQEMQRKNGQPNMVPPGTPRPPMQPQGLDSLESNVGEEYAHGGIVMGFTGEDGSMVVDPMLGTMVDNRPPKDDLTFLERIGVLNPENRRANEKLERELRLREQGVKSEVERGRLRDPRALASMPSAEEQLAQVAQTAAKESEKKQTGQSRVNVPEAPGIVSALPPAQTEAYKKLTEMMNQDPEVKAKALQDRYMKEVGSRDLSIYDQMAQELKARKERLNAPKAGYDATMEYLQQIALGGGRTSAEAGSRGAANQRALQQSRRSEQDTLMEKILDLGAKKSDAQFAEKKGMFEMTQRERDDIFKKAFDAAKSVNSSDDEAKRIAAQAVENELNRKNQIRVAGIGAQDRDQLMNRAKALMAVDKTLGLEEAMKRAAMAAGATQMEGIDVRKLGEYNKAAKEIQSRYMPVLLNRQTPEGAKMRAALAAELAEARLNAGLPPEQGLNALPGAASSGKVAPPPGFKRD